MADPSAASPATAPGDHPPPLAGYTVAVASDRRRHHVADLLESVGARTVGVQAARSMPKPDEQVLREATRQCLTYPCDDVVFSSSLGLRSWLAAARRWGEQQRLLDRFTDARLLARDASTADTLRGLGFTSLYSTDQESTEELLRYLASQPVAGRRIVVQTHQLTLADACAALRAAGATVLEVPTFTAAPPAETFSLNRLCDLTIRAQVDAVALLGGDSAEHLRQHAVRQGRFAALRDALRDRVLCAALGPLTAAPLATAHPRVASQPFPAYLAETLLTELPSRALAVATGGRRLEVRGHAVVLDGRYLPVQAGPLGVLRALASQPGEVRSASELRRALGDPAETDDHAVEMAVSRLRRALRAAGGDALVETIVRQGYRLVP